MRADRILVAGASGSGKTTLAGRIAGTTGIPHTEIDALFHFAGWTPNPRFAEEVADLAARASRVTEWQYDRARPLLAARAQVLVWLDLPRRQVLLRVIRRTLRRRLRREELWNGNRERPLRTILTDPDHIVRWLMSTYDRYPDRVREALALHPQLRLVRVRTTRDSERLLRLLAGDHAHLDGIVAR